MSPLASDPRLDAARARVSRYLAEILSRGAELALELHADALGIEHVLGAAIRDEESAATQAIAFAFADPETVLMEVYALSPGILMVGSASTRAFSPLAVEALAAARARAAAEGAADVGIAHLALAAASVLPSAVRARLVAGGMRASELGGAARDANAAPGEKLGDAAKHALSRAARAAAAAHERTIGPARILVACLGAPEAEAALGLGATRARVLLEGAFVDASEPAPRSIAADPALLDFLDRLPSGAGTLDLLRACHDDATPELRELLGRHKLGLELIGRAAGKLADPD